MKKALKIILPILILLGLAGFIVCSILIPNQLHDFWKLIYSYLNEQLPIVGVSAVVIGAFAWKIFQNTSFGKRAINKIKKELNETKNEAKAFKENADKTREEFDIFKNNTIGVLKEFSDKLDNYTEDIVKLCETSPNAKIKAFGEKLKTKYAEDKEYLNNVITEIGEKVDFKPHIDIDEYVKCLEELRAKVERLENNNGEETINSVAEEE